MTKVGYKHERISIGRKVFDEARTAVCKAVLTGLTQASSGYDLGFLSKELHNIMTEL